MRILGISGSPKKNGFTNLLLDKALEGARTQGAKTEKIVLNDLVFKPCQECGGCDDTGKCVLRDDMTRLYEKLSGADSFIVASPIYFGTVTAQLKAMIDRVHCLWVDKYILNKRRPLRDKHRGIFLCVGGKDKKEYFEDTKKVIKIMYAVLDIEYTYDLFVGGMNSMPADSENRKEALQKAFDLGTKLAAKKTS